MKMTNSERVQAWRRRAKLRVVEVCGGKCNLCGYDKCMEALEFHHLDPSQKDFPITSGRVTRALSKMFEEAQKCIMVCANCHREIHYGMVDPSALESKRMWDSAAAAQLLAETETRRKSTRFKPKVYVE